jgi:hypothetical protein
MAGRDFVAVPDDDGVVFPMMAAEKERSAVALSSSGPSVRAAIGRSPYDR